MARKTAQEDSEMLKKRLETLRAAKECTECELNEIDMEIYARTKELFLKKQELAAMICQYKGEIVCCEIKLKQK